MLVYINIMHIIMILLLFALIMVVSYAFEVNADSLERAFLAVQLGYLGKPFAALFSFLF